MRTKLPDTAVGSGTIHADLGIEFAGQTVQYKQVEFKQTAQGTSIRLTGAIPAKVADFKIDPPSLLAMPIKNDMPVRVDMTWRPQ